MTSIETGTDQLLATLTNGVAVITLNRPEARNALTNETIAWTSRQRITCIAGRPKTTRRQQKHSWRKENQCFADGNERRWQFTVLID